MRCQQQRSDSPRNGNGKAAGGRLPCWSRDGRCDETRERPITDGGVPDTKADHASDDGKWSPNDDVCECGTDSTQGSIQTGNDGVDCLTTDNLQSTGVLCASRWYVWCA